MSDTQTSGPLSIDDALDAMETSPETPPAKEVEEEVKAEEVETVEDTVEDDEADTVEDEAPEAEEAEESQVLTMEEYGDVQIQIGEEVITLADLQKGTLRQSDYTRKTTELATERKQLEATKAELAEKQRQLDAAILNATGEEQEPDWAAMAEDDPLGYIPAKAKWDAKQAQKRQAMEAQERAQIESINQTRAESAEIALKVYPSWSDPAEFNKGEPTRRSIAGELGFSDAEYDSVNDYRFAVLLEMAAKGKTKQAEAKIAEKKIRKAPKVLKPGTSKTKADRNAAETETRQRKLGRPHSLKDHLDIMYEG